MVFAFSTNRRTVIRNPLSEGRLIGAVRIAEVLLQQFDVSDYDREGREEAQAMKAGKENAAIALPCLFSARLQRRVHPSNSSATSA